MVRGDRENVRKVHFTCPIVRTQARYAKESMTFADAVVTTGRVGLAAVLLAAGPTKLVALDRFVATVAAFRVLPSRMSRPFAFVLPWVEVVLAVGLLLSSDWVQLSAF